MGRTPLTAAQSFRRTTPSLVIVPRQELGPARSIPAFRSARTKVLYYVGGGTNCGKLRSAPPEDQVYLYFSQFYRFPSTGPIVWVGRQSVFAKCIRFVGLPTAKLKRLSQGEPRKCIAGRKSFFSISHAKSLMLLTPPSSCSKRIEQKY